MQIEWTTIIVAILAIFGSSSVINLLFQEFFKPNISSELILSQDFQSATIEVANIGSRLASNVTTIVIAPVNITSVKNLFSPPGLKITDSGRLLNIGNIDKDINNNVLQVSIPNLVNGDSSKIKLRISFLENKIYNNTSEYRISTFHAQGSINGTIKKSEPQLNNITDSLTYRFEGILNTNPFLQILNYLTPVITFGSMILVFWLPKVRSRKDILENVIFLRYSIQFAPQQLSINKISNWLSKTTKEKLSLFHNDKCILLDDFYGILNVYLKNHDKLNEEEKKRLKNECIELSNKIFIRERIKQKNSAQ